MCSVSRRVGPVQRDVQRLPRACHRRAAGGAVVRQCYLRRPGPNEDFGLEQVTGNPADRYAFRTSPLRNAVLQPAFMHNGAFVRLADAIRYHLDPTGRASSYTPELLATDLRGPRAPIAPLLARLDVRLRAPVALSDGELDALVDFVGNGLLDPAARPQYLRRLIPERLPSGRAPFRFEFP